MRAAFIFGCQRSGSTAFHRCLGSHPSVEAFPEDDTRAFYDWRIRQRHEVRRLLEGDHRLVALFKPIGDSHRADHLLAAHAPAIAFWLFRSPHRVVNSMARELERSVEYACEEIERGLLRFPGHRFHRMFDEIFDAASPHDVLYLHWLIKNSLVLQQDLERRPEVLFCAYEELLSSTAARAAVSGHLCLDVSSQLKGMAPVGTPFRPPIASPHLVAECEALYQRLLSRVSYAT